MSDWLTPLARAVLAALAEGPGTPEELGRRCFLPPALITAALAELSDAGHAEEAEPRRWRARRTSRG